MTRKRHLLISLLLSAMLLGAQSAGAADGETVRPELGKPLQAAQELIKAQKYKDALAKVREADAIGSKTAYESFVVDRMRGAAAAGAGDDATAVKSFEAVIKSGRLAAPEALKLSEAIAGSYYRAKDYANAMKWAQSYFKDGGSSPHIRTLLIQSQFLGGDYAGAAKELTAELANDEKAGKTPGEDRLQLLANCHLKLKDYVGYTAALERLVAHYPKRDYWNDLLLRTAKKPGFSDRLSLDLYRLQLATGNVHEPGEYMEMAQMALQAGLPAEAKKIIDQAFAKNILGAGADADRHKRLRDMANKQAADDLKTMPQSEAQVAGAKDGNAAVNLGFAYVTAGQAEKGIALMEKGIQKGGLRRPEDAKLHLAIAYLNAGNKAKAQQGFKSVQGSDGASDLARLWLLHSK